MSNVGGKKLTVTSIGEDIEQLELTYTTTRNINWFSNFGNLVGSCLLKLNICISCDSAVLLLGIYSPEMCIDMHGKIHIRIFKKF